MLLVGGLAQGTSMHDPTLAFTESTESILPYLRGRSVSGMLLTVAHFVFAFHFGLMLFGLGRTASVPTFLNPQEEETLEAHYMKGIVPLFLGIFGTFAFSWAGLIADSELPNRAPRTRKRTKKAQDVYPAPKSGMAERGRQIYAANGCVYCHSQQVRADYAAIRHRAKMG